MAVVCSEIGEDFPLQGIQDHLFDSEDDEDEGEPNQEGKGVKRKLDEDH